MYSMRPVCARRVAALVGAAIAILSGRQPAAQTATAPTLKAAFLYNLAKFTAWPSEALGQGAPISLCVLGDGVVAETLAQAVKGQTLGGHAVAAVTVTGDAPLRSCQLLYVSGIDQHRARQLLAGLLGAPVLTVSDLDRFAQIGGIAAFYMEGDNMRIAINMEAAQRARVQVSSKLLSLARIVKDDHVLPLNP
jgi:hypothetical protein